MDPRALARLIRSLEAASYYVGRSDRGGDGDRFARGYVAGLQLALDRLREEQEHAAAA